MSDNNCDEVGIGVKNFTKQEFYPIISLLNQEYWVSTVKIGIQMREYSEY